MFRLLRNVWVPLGFQGTILYYTRHMSTYDDNFSVFWRLRQTLEITSKRRVFCDGINRSFALNVEGANEELDSLLSWSRCS